MDATHIPVADDALNGDNFVQNGSLPTAETTINIKGATASIPDHNAAGPTPVDDVADGIQPVASFVPKDAPNLSHPTPPPEQPLVTSAADIDVDMADVDAPVDAPVSAPAPAVVEPEPFPAPAEPSLVRPREDDDDDEPAAKRSRVEEGLVAGVVNAPEPEIAPATLPATNGETEGESSTEVQAEVATAPALDVEVDAKATDAATGSTEVAVATANGGGAEPPVVETAQPSIETQTSEVPAEAPGGDAPPASTAPPSSDAVQYDTRPVTPAQKSYLLEKMKNLKKTKNTAPFLKPVDPVALGIPRYPEIVKHPMDLTTMEAKLKDNQYGSVQAFVDDFNQIIENCRLFNGAAHPVTQSAMALEAYFNRAMEQVPRADQPPAAPKAAKRSPSIPKPPPRRESRAAAAAASPTGGETFALQPDGTPQIRRDSTMNRPARAIKPPANRELTYAKPKRKEHMLELKFCDYMLDALRSPKHAQFNQIFLVPVDPVALNIPHYRQIVKNPMDLSTMGQKLKQGQYGRASEFKKDFDLMIGNCLAFNPPGNAVRDIGIGFQRQFQELWNQKDKWERQHKPESHRGTSASGDEDEEDEDEEDDEPEDDKEQTIRQLQKQLADMQSSLASALTGGAKPPKQKKAKTKTGPSKSLGSLSSKPSKSAAPKKAAQPKKPRMVTYEEKQEISEAVSSEKMSDKLMAELTGIITKNCPKYADNEEMELEIDDLPNHVQLMLLNFVRGIFGRPKKAVRSASPDDVAAVDDDDFEPERGPRGAGKRKKHKPMGKKEQQETINTLKSKLTQFNPTSDEGSPSSSFLAKQEAESSGDEESEESEEE